MHCNPKKIILFSSVHSGFTILEVTVAMFIFGCVLTAVLHFMIQGDTINGRRAALSAASMAASNQLELLRRQEETSDITEDTTYDETINGIDLKVRRSRIRPENGKADELNPLYNEYALLVRRALDDTLLVTLRLLQGTGQTYGKTK